jgi:acetylornithine deacetylase
MTAKALLKELIAIPSVNPDQVLNPEDDPHAGEERMAEFLAKKFKELGADEVEVEDLRQQWAYNKKFPSVARPNVYGVWKTQANNAKGATGSSKWVAIDVHIDTVSVAGMTPYPPFSGVETADGRLHGRGACDTKATLACAISLLEELSSRADGAPLQTCLPVNLIICGSVGEETSCLGANGFRAWLKRKRIFVEEILVAEPTCLVPVVAHKGDVRLRFSLIGKVKIKALCFWEQAYGFNVSLSRQHILRSHTLAKMPSSRLRTL